MHTPNSSPTPTLAFSSWWTDQNTDRICRSESECVAALYGHYFVKVTTLNVCLCTHTGILTSTHIKHCLIMMSVDVVSPTEWQLIKKGVLWRYNTIPCQQTRAANILANWPLDLIGRVNASSHEIYPLHRAQFMASFQRVWEVPNSLMKNSWARTGVKTRVCTHKRGKVTSCVLRPIVSPILMLEMFPEDLMLVWLTVLILFLLKDFSTRWALQ